ncbi:MAG TPA: penicillin acylase family protein [Conexibacter sp.]
MTDRYVLDGLGDAVEILVDRWGIPHIYAGGSRDAWFAQGFNVARERLWQLDTWRRAGLGHLAEVLGPAYVERDRAARLFLYRGSMEAEWSAYGVDLDELLTPFVAGVNAYVREVAGGSAPLPPEFALLDYEPAEWTVEDVLRIRAHGRYRNLHSEVARARMLCEHGPAAEALRAPLEPDVELVVPDGLDLSLVTADVLDVYDLASGLAPSDPLASMRLPGGEGSNNWALAGVRTASGRPILANDPHRALPVPALRYLVHVACPELAFAGGGEPMLPGISFGHNGHMAFGLTVVPIDQEDLYVYELDEVGGDRYRYGSGWEAMEVERQTIRVRDEDPVEVTLKFTRHGPVVRESPDRNAAFAVRAAWLEAGMAPYLGSAALLATRGWEAFRSAARHWGGPGENLVYADVDGDVGWQPAGRVPIRPNWSGLLPVPGDGRYEWAGYLAHDALPHEHNPARGWVASANQCNVPPERAGGVGVTFEWDPPFRHRRIAEVLEQAREHTVRQSVALQNDYLCLAAREVLPLLEDLTLADPSASEAGAMLREWDGRLDADSAAAAVFELWFRKHLRRRLFGHALARAMEPREVERAVDALLADESVVHDAQIDLDLLPTVGGAHETIVEASLSETIAELRERLGPDPARWSWGDLHQAALAHPLTADAIPPLPAVPRGGGCDTVGNTTYGPHDLRESIGATTRIVIDVGGWDASVAMNAPGQAGDPTSAHYADLLPRWADDESVPLLFSREAVEAATERRIVLSPTEEPA